jgi:hypothetical protein
MPPQYVKAYLKRGKNDAADAAAICEAVGRPSMRFVAIKPEKQQAVLVMHRKRDLLVRQRTQLINPSRGHAAEFGIIGAQGRWNVARHLVTIREGCAVPELARAIIEMLALQLDGISERIDAIDARINAWHKANPVSQRLATIPGIVRSSALLSRPPRLTRQYSGAPNPKSGIAFTANNYIVLQIGSPC